MDAWEDWQKPYRFGTIVIWPPDHVREVVNDQRQAYDPVSQSICDAHITVTQPLLKKLTEEQWGQIRGLLQTFDDFKLEYGPLNSFLPYPCIWYEVQPTEKILELRHALHKTGCFNLSLSHTHDFIPHMTITEGLSGPVVHKGLLEQLQAESRSDSFQVSQLAYIVPDADFWFSVKQVLPLGKGS